MIVASLAGGILAGLYGILHDNITYSISPEYFTKLKFQQFHYANLGLGDRVFASTIGFLATFWVGLFSTWLLARRLIPQQPRQRAYRQILLGVLCIILFAVLFGFLGYLYGLSRGPDADYSVWLWAIDKYRITHVWPFIRVAYLHNTGYLGALTGLVVALIVIRPKRSP